MFDLHCLIFPSVQSWPKTLFINSPFTLAPNPNRRHHEDLRHVADGNYQSYPRRCEKSSLALSRPRLSSSMFLTPRSQSHQSSRAAPPLPGYGVEEMQWSFKPPFGQPIFINGTVQDVKHSLGDIDIMRTDPNNEVVHPMAPAQERSVAKDTISAQFCGSFPVANSHHISAQIPAITTISGPAVIGPGPGNCAQVSCAENSAVWWCNDVGLGVDFDESTIIDVQQLKWLTICSAIPQSSFLRECSKLATQ